MAHLNHTPSAAESVQSMLEKAWQVLQTVCDPEIPVLTVLDLGVVRSLTCKAGHYQTTGTPEKPMSAPVWCESGVNTPQIRVEITPTYTGCPAMNMIAAQIRLALTVAESVVVDVVEVLQPAWTTDWISAAGRQKLHEYGIAPPQSKARMDKMLFSIAEVPCPRCGSIHTEQVAEFGSTSCKSLYRCLDCREPFDYFKCH